MLGELLQSLLTRRGLTFVTAMAMAIHRIILRHLPLHLLLLPAMMIIILPPDLLI
jgi:hypothetical protein